MEKKGEEQMIWKSEQQPESMISITIGRAMTTLLASSTKKLLHSMSSLSPHSNDTTRPPLGSLEDSLWLLYNYVKDNRRNNLDLILIPIIQNCLVSKDSKRGGQTIVLVNWLFQDEFVFEALATSLIDIIEKKEDRYVAIGWCFLVRSLVEYESCMDRYALNGIRDNFDALLRMLSSSIPRLCTIVCNGSTLQDGFELPSRLSLSAADCILSISVELTKKCNVPSNNLKSLNSNASDNLISLAPSSKAKKKAKATCNTSKVLNIEMAYLLWNQMEDLNNLLQRLLAWSRKSRPLHTKGVEQVLKWLKEIKGHYGQFKDKKDADIIKTGAMLLSSCWKHYGILLHLEDRKFSQHCNELLDQYISGIQYYADNQSGGHTESSKSGLETIKFFLNCLCLLLGRFDSRKFETCMSEYGTQISSVLLLQFHSVDEDVIGSAVCIFKLAIFKPNTSGYGLLESQRMDSMLPSLLHLLDERDSTARAVTMLIAEYYSVSADNLCLEQVLRRLASGNALQRRNAIDVISELVHITADSVNKHSNLAWQEVADSLIGCLNDDEIYIREQSSNLLSMIEPSLVLPALVHLSCSSEREQSYASAALIAMLKCQNHRPEVICMLIDCLSGHSQSLDLSGHAGVASEGPKVDIYRLLKLIPEWSKSVQDWRPLIGPLIDKMFTEPANAIIVRFLSYISENLADSANEVLGRVLLEMKGQKELENRTCPTSDSGKTQQSLFEHLCPLLLIRLLPLRVFNDLDSSVMYGQLATKGITGVSECEDINIVGHECVAAFLLKRAFSSSEFEDIRKLAAELCGRIHPQVLFPIASSLLQHAASFHDILKIKTCLFSVCTSIMVREVDAISHPANLEIRRTVETVLLWPSSEGDEVSKAQHGCIDYLALMICAELQALPSSKQISKSFTSTGNTAARISVLAYVTHELVTDKNEVVSSATFSDENYMSAAAVNSFRLCMANVLISTCQKISYSGKKHFAEKVIPCLIHSVEVMNNPEIRAACIQVIFSAVYHLKSIVLPYSFDLFKLSLKFLREGSEKERMGGAKLMTSLMASEDVIVESISEGLLEARSVLSRVSLSDPSHDLRQICHKLLICIAATPLSTQ